MSTTFTGRFDLDRPLTEEHRAILEDFYEEEHMYEDGLRGGPGMPDGFYCQWQPTEDGAGLEWDGVEKFYHFEEWLEYLVAHYIKPWRYVLNGSVAWESIFEPEEGTLVVRDNSVVAIPKLNEPG
jgi:hypothetical protein